MRVRNRLLILVLSVLVPAFAASALAVWYVYAEEQKAQEQGMVEAARAFALLVEKELRTRECILLTLASSPSLARGDLAEFYDHARTMAPSPVSAIILFSEDGQQRINTRLPLGAPLPARRVSNLPALMQQYGRDRTLVSDVFMAPVARRHDFTVQVPVRRGNEIRDYLVMGVNASALQPLLAKQSFPKSWIATIVDRNGVVLARSRMPEQYIGRTVREYTRSLLTASREGVYRSTTLDGIPVKAFYARIPIADWSILISIPEAEIQRASSRAATFLATIMVLLLGLAVLAAREVARRAIKPIEQLGIAAEKLGHGEEVSFVPQGLQEVDSVGLRLAEASRKIQSAQRELEQRVAEAISATERAQRTLLQSQKLEALGRLTGGIAHEFNNLLQTLSAALQLAKITRDPERMGSLIDTCEKAVDRATALTGRLSAFGRIQEAKLSTIHPHERINGFKRLIAGILPSNIALQIRTPDTLWPVSVDPLQFELALLNIAVNARDAMPHGGALTIEADNRSLAQAPDGLPAGEYVHIAISDTGDGMPPEVLAKALDPFFTTKAVGKGSGLGLPQAYGFARQSQGTLVLGSSIGQGTTVEIYLPRTGEPVSGPGPEPGPEPAKSGNPAQPPARGTILFVEDDPLVREAVVPVLEHAGFTILPATTAQEALATLGSGAAVDIVFSDIVMPGQMSGIELAGIVRERFPAIRIILATGYTDQRIAIPGVELLAKPYRLEDAIRLLREAAEHGRR